MKALLVRTSGLVEVVDFPKDNKLNWYYKQLGCDCVDIIKPYGLEELANIYNLQSVIGKFCIICDDEALVKEEPKINVIASLLYGVDSHGQLICGDVLIAKNEETDDGIETVGMNQGDMFLIHSGINSLIEMHNEKAEKADA